MGKSYLKNITVKNFENSKDFLKYDSVLKNLNGKNIFAGQKFNLNEISYIVVRNIEKMLRRGAKDKNVSYSDLCKIFVLAFGVSDDDFWNASVVDYYYARNYLIYKLTELRENESKLLKSISMNSHLWEQAGGKRLDVFGDIMPLVKLGRIYGVYPMDLKNKPYNEILTLLVLHKTDDEVNYNYNKLQNPKPVK